MIQQVEAYLPRVGWREVFEVEHHGSAVRVVPGPELSCVWVHRGRRLERFVPADDPELAEVLYRCGFSL